MQGASFSGHERNHLFMQFDDGFSEISGVSGADSIADGRAFGWLDFNGDQQRDFVLVNANAPRVQIFENQIDNPGGSVQIQLVGGATDLNSNGWSNRDGVGAMVTVRIGEQVTSFESHAGEGFASQNSATMIIGIGTAPVIDTLLVKWPSGREQTISNIQRGSQLVIRERQE
jgi:enediyne biosynthesis protein E4